MEREKGHYDPEKVEGVLLRITITSCNTDENDFWILVPIQEDEQEEDENDEKG
ncbi:hypothetical protein KSF_101800 [Reticulibacter mediterranei]|uniref:Uncharacterized protein n=1 Tax=Reticulibacter mediterranei TaxID=2778369 RepID=A0A8J3N696_9CHLR|nr:hypothetical protein KSF_101800 [Reticulibacter mediterranei]